LNSVFTGEANGLQVFPTKVIRKIIEMWLKHVLLVSAILTAVQSYTRENRREMEESSRPSFAKYLRMRQEALNDHLERALGADIVLNEREKHLNSILMDMKSEELSQGFQNPFNFTPSRHFFDVWKSVESSPLFKLIKSMPKGIYQNKLLSSELLR
jgi:Adenosine/AMP deaminase N-terminal